MKCKSWEQNKFFNRLPGVHTLPLPLLSHWSLLSSLSRWFPLISQFLNVEKSMNLFYVLYSFLDDLLQSHGFKYTYTQRCLQPRTLPWARFLEPTANSIWPREVQEAPLTKQVQKRVLLFLPTSALPVEFSNSVNDNSFFGFVQTQTLESSWFYSLTFHPIFQQILSTVSSNYIQNWTLTPPLLPLSARPPLSLTWITTVAS